MIPMGRKKHAHSLNMRKRGGVLVCRDATFFLAPQLTNLY